MFKDITPQELYNLKTSDKVIVDVRSPKEYNDATIPGAINIPLFTDDERAEVGTIYKQEGQEAAKDRGLEIYSKKLPAFINAFKQLPQPITVFCWRGGMRSKTAATVLDLMNINVNRLSGGIKAYRLWMKEQLDTVTIPELYVLNGHTGNGKTKILQRLKKQGYPVINLEQLASHRGSIFGQIGLEPTNQRTFDLQLGEALLHYQYKPYIVIEGESSRIGKIKIPERFFNQKETSRQLFISLPIEKRIELILSDYHPETHHDQFVEAFSIIKRRIHTPIAHQIDEALESRDYHAVIRDLLDYYYDPRYNHSTAYPEELMTTIEASSLEEAIDLVKQLLPKLQ
ncbi:MAG: tRNA 2-selenouridine(34) synthase MnmH [Bacillota bacterium]